MPHATPLVDLPNGRQAIQLPDGALLAVPAMHRDTPKDIQNEIVHLVARRQFGEAWDTATAWDRKLRRKAQLDAQHIDPDTRQWRTAGREETMSVARYLLRAHRGDIDAITRGALEEAHLAASGGGLPTLAQLHWVTAQRIAAELLGVDASDYKMLQAAAKRELRRLRQASNAGRATLPQAA